MYVKSDGANELQHLLGPQAVIATGWLLHGWHLSFNPSLAGCNIFGVSR